MESILNYDVLRFDNWEKMLFGGVTEVKMVWHKAGEPMVWGEVPVESPHSGFTLAFHFHTFSHFRAASILGCESLILCCGSAGTRACELGLQELLWGAPRESGGSTGKEKLGAGTRQGPEKAYKQRPPLPKPAPTGSICPVRSVLNIQPSSPLSPTFYLKKCSPPYVHIFFLSLNHLGKSCGHWDNLA